MAPDRGPPTRASRVEDVAAVLESHEDAMDTQQKRRHSDARKYLGEHAAEGQNFTARGILVGLGVGIIICFSNMYFGLQTGWISGMTMPSSLIGFAVFKTIARHLSYPFTPVENVLVQTVAGAVGTMPLACGFVGVMPALEYLLLPAENGPLGLGIGNLMIWSLGICFFGVVFTVPLRREMLLRERLKFPSGTATALMIGVLHGDSKTPVNNDQESNDELTSLIPDGGSVGRDSDGEDASPQTEQISEEESSFGLDGRHSWKAKVKLLVYSFAVSGFYTLMSYFIPILRDLPVFGLPLARTWLWTLNPSPAYVGQGIIMGPTTTLHMLLGTVIGWGVLSPLAKSKGWAPGPVDNWEHGSKGWIVWVSLAIMLADSLISLGWLAGRPLFKYDRDWILENIGTGEWRSLFRFGQSTEGYTSLTPDGSVAERDGASSSSEDKDVPEENTSPEHLVSQRTVVIGLIASVLFCIWTIRFVFGELVPMYATVAAVILALLLSVMGVRALGETDLNPVSGISKLTQLFFSLIIPQSNRNSVLINLVAGAVSEAGAQQAGDLMQDLKTGHLLGAAPKAQFHGQLIGSFVGAIASAAVYKLYTAVYPIPGNLFQVPTAYVWIFTARLVTGKGLPPMAREWASGAAVLFAIATSVRIAGKGKRWQGLIPGGIAVAVGIYNVPSFTLARVVGGLLNWYWRSCRRREETPVIVLASGLILGEGVMSIISLMLASLNVPHL